MSLGETEHTGVVSGGGLESRPVNHLPTEDPWAYLSGGLGGRGPRDGGREPR